jgi:hypothetical protein
MSTTAVSPLIGSTSPNSTAWPGSGVVIVSAIFGLTLAFTVTVPLASLFGLPAPG